MKLRAHLCMLASLVILPLASCAHRTRGEEAQSPEAAIQILCSRTPGDSIRNGQIRQHLRELKSAPRAERAGLLRARTASYGIAECPLADRWDGAASIAAPPEGAEASLGYLPKEAIRSHVERHLPQISYCYEKETRPADKGTLVVTFIIRMDGTVADVSADDFPGSAEMGPCVAEVLRKIHFPKPVGGGAIRVTYPFHFSVQ